MNLLDLVHILTFSSDSIVIEHVAVCQASQLRAWELCISTEIKSMNCNTNDVWGIQYKQSTCHSRNWQRPRRRECHAGVQSEMKNKEIMRRRLRHRELFSPVAAVDEAEADLGWDRMGKAGWESGMRPTIWFSATTSPCISQHHHFAVQAAQSLRRETRLEIVWNWYSSSMNDPIRYWMSGAIRWTPWIYCILGLEYFMSVRLKQLVVPYF